MTENVKIWQEIKVIVRWENVYQGKSIICFCKQGAVFDINKAGINPIEVLLWSREKRLDEVQNKLEQIKKNGSKVKMEGFKQVIQEELHL